MNLFDIYRYTILLFILLFILCIHKLLYKYQTKRIYKILIILSILSCLIMIIKHIIDIIVCEKERNKFIDAANNDEPINYEEFKNYYDKDENLAISLAIQLLNQPIWNIGWITMLNMV